MSQGSRRGTDGPGAGKGDAGGAPAVAIALPRTQKRLVEVGCVCMMLSVSMYGLAFSTLTAPILESVDAIEYIGLFSIFAALGVSVMTPIGGKLGDLIGRRNIIVVPGLVCAAAGVAFAFARSVGMLLALRLVISLAQGAFTAAPYIIAGLINERKDVPRMMGFLAMAIAIGGFGGSIVAGILTDLGLMTVAMLLPAAPLLAGVALIGLNMPNQKKAGKVTIDVAGMVALAVALCGILLSLNFAPSLGWGSPYILGGLAVGVVAIVVLVRVEGRATEPLIPLCLFRNRYYVALLVVGFICYFYQPAMNVYAPIGALEVMGSSAAVAGALQMPRMILVMALPAAVGVWVAKRQDNYWKAMAVATLLAGVPMLAMALTSPELPVAVYFVALGVTGVAESFRSVSITPAAQATLTPEDIGVGTSLVNFFNSLASSVAAAVFALTYNLKTAPDPTSLANVQAGVNLTFLVAGVVSVVGFLIVLLVVRPQVRAGDSA